MEPKWKILSPDPAAVRRLREALGCHRITAIALANRNILGRRKALDFLQSPLSGIRPPFALADIDAAAARVHQALAGREKILVFGDYDVDGVTATTLMAEFLESAGGRVRCHIPHRINEGYGLAERHIHEVAAPAGIDLIITVDCGSTSHEAVAAARAAGIDVIITDHHQIDPPLPAAVAVVNPRRADCGAGLGHLAGVGVAYYLIIRLRALLREKGYWQGRPEPNLKALCDLVALGTVADMVPLTEENRILSKAGIALMNRYASGQGPGAGCGDGFPDGKANTGQANPSQDNPGPGGAGFTGRPGIQALMVAAGIHKRAADAADIAFRLAPRINAAGRLGHAGQALELMTTRDPARAARIAAELDQLNQERQALQARIMAAVDNQIRLHPSLLSGRSLVLASDKWHEGVLGIVASQAADRHGRPVFLIATRNGMGKGSGRSVAPVDLHDVLKACADTLIGFGGHAMAAGLSIETDRIPAFRDRFEAAVRAAAPEGVRQPELIIDCELDLSEVNDQLLDELAALGPFGEGNPEPLFLTRNPKVAFSKIVGERHRRMVLRPPGRSAGGIAAMAFNIDPAAPPADRYGQVAFRLCWNHYNGRRTPQMIIAGATAETTC